MTCICSCAPRLPKADMFTGIIEGLAEVCGIARQKSDCRFCFRPLFAMKDIQDGESISVNGVCLSVEKHEGEIFRAYASAETLGRSNLAALEMGGKVNLERALALGERLGGHMVSGHVDCLATLSAMRRQGQSIVFRFSFPGQYGPEVIEKGSVALDGISLTVNECGADFLEVNVIPDTRKRTNMGQWRPGSKVNMETDLIGKYVVRFLRQTRPGGKSGLDRDFLSRHGFLGN